MTLTAAIQAYDEWEARQQHMPSDKKYSRPKTEQPRKGTLAEFIVSLPRDTPRSEVVKRARSKGFYKCTVATVSSSRWAYPLAVARASNASTPAEPAGPRLVRQPTPEPEPRLRMKKSSDELREELRRIAVRLGTDAVEEVLADLLIKS